MPEPLALADASKRLRKRPGRPRKAVIDVNVTSGPVASQASARPEKVARGYISAAPVADMWPRLLDLKGSARYTSLSTWTIRDYLAGGILRRVELPSATRGTTRRVLLDRLDLDALVEASKTGAEAVRSPQ
jgi:hypothetical protein